MKKTIIIAIIATLVAATITGCGNKGKDTTSQATADEATYDSASVVETIAATEPTPSVEPSSAATGSTQPTTVAPSSSTRAQIYAPS